MSLLAGCKSTALVLPKPTLPRCFFSFLLRLRSQNPSFSALASTSRVEEPPLQSYTSNKGHSVWLTSRLWLGSIVSNLDQTFPSQYRSTSRGIMVFSAQLMADSNTPTQAALVRHSCGTKAQTGVGGRHCNIYVCIILWKQSEQYRLRSLFD